MKIAKKSSKSIKAHDLPAVRASISFPPELYEILEKIAKEKKVSLAWVVRDATEKYVTNVAAMRSSE